MTTARHCLSSALLCLIAGGALAHPVDELAQSSYLGVLPTKVTLELNLTPGDKLVSAFFALTQKPGYAAQLVGEQALWLDGKALSLRLVRTEPLGDAKNLRLFLEAPLGALPEGKHTLRYENHHAPLKSAYTAATLAGTDGITIGEQTHDPTQQALTVAFQARPLTPENGGTPAVGIVALALVACGLYARVRRRG